MKLIRPKNTNFTGKSLKFAKFGQFLIHVYLPSRKETSSKVSVVKWTPASAYRYDL